MITVNGKARDLLAPLPVAQVVNEFTGSDQPRGVAVALNGAVVPRTAWDSTMVGDGDRVEVLSATQGG